MELKEIAESRIGKYIQWKNGYRLFVVGKDPNYPDCFIVRNPKDNKEWASVASNIAEAVEISETEALQEFAEIGINTPQVALDCCGQWRVGKENISLKFDLKQGEISLNESYRIKNLIEDFFKSHNIAARAFGTNNGIELEFISTKETENKPCCS